MSKLIGSDYDFQGVNRPINIPQSSANGQPVVHEQLAAALEGRAFKDNVRVKSTGNVNLAAPGATIDGVAMSSGDRFLAGDQTTTTQNGIYVWTGAATPATRALDADTGEKLESAVVTVDEGANAGTTWRQNTVNFVIGVGSPNWVAFGTGTPQGSETVTGAWEAATQAEANTGTSDLLIMTAKKVRDLSYLPLTREFTIGDGTATQFTVTHNWNTKKVSVLVVQAAGQEEDVEVEVQRNGVNTVILKITPAPAANSLVAYVTRLGIVS